MLADGNFQVTKIQEQVMGKNLSETNMEEVLGRNLIQVNLNVEMKKLPGKEVDTKQPSIVSSEIFGNGEINDSKIVKDFLKSRIQEVI